MYTLWIDSIDPVDRVGVARIRARACVHEKPHASIPSVLVSSCENTIIWIKGKHGSLKNLQDISLEHEPHFNFKRLPHATAEPVGSGLYPVEHFRFFALFF